MATPTLTLMRRGLWQAVDAWPQFNGYFKQKFRSEGRGQLQPKDYVPVMKDLPCIAMAPLGPPLTEWVKNQVQRIQYTIDVTVWTSWRSVLEGEYIWEEFNRCIWQQGAVGATVPFLEDENFSGLNDHTVVRPQSLAIFDDAGKQTMLRWSWAITLQRDWNPRQETFDLDLVEAI